MPKITKRLVESIRPSDRDVVQWDSELRGFGVRVKPSGVRSYMIQYRNSHSSSRRYTIGQHGRLTAEEARKEARQLLADVARGGDPAEGRMVAQKQQTLAQFAEHYFEQHAIGRKKASTIETDRINLRCHIIPALGKVQMGALSRSNVLRLYSAMKDRPGAANRTLALLSHMMNVAEEEGLRAAGSNPCRGIKKFKEKRRERYLSPSELSRLGEILAEAERTGTENSNTIAAIRLLILTGCRRSEILGLRWEQVDFENACLRLPDSKTGARVVHLNAPALQVLSTIERRAENPYVIYGFKPGTHVADLKRPWRRIRHAADLEDLRLHDLRHSFASTAVGLGESLHITGKLLGHSQARTTERYAHVANDPAKAATERVGAAISGMMAGKTGEVVRLKRQ